nr:MAG TPA: hypothetical protein [Bacteriophage sp.]
MILLIVKFPIFIFSNIHIFTFFIILLHVLERIVIILLFNLKNLKV